MMYGTNLNTCCPTGRRHTQLQLDTFLSKFESNSLQGSSERTAFLAEFAGNKNIHFTTDTIRLKIFGNNLTKMMPCVLMSFFQPFQCAKYYEKHLQDSARTTQ
jgi:hypothetical protein